MKKKQKAVVAIICAMAATLIILSGIQIVRIIKDYRAGDLLYRQTLDKYVTPGVILPEEYKDADSENDNGINAANSAEDLYSGIGKNTDETEWSSLISVDLESIQLENKEVIGWIYFENEDISYPILYSGDDYKYLRMSYTGQTMTAGSIFMEGANSPDFSDRHTIIYGHNMKNLSMFGRLKYYRTDVDYYESHRYFQIITNDYCYRYLIFAYEEITDDTGIYNINFLSDINFTTFVNDEIIAKSFRNTGIDITGDDKIITLSTCSSGNDRFTVSAVRCGEVSINN